MKYICLSLSLLFSSPEPPNQYPTSVPGSMFYQPPPMPPNPTVDTSGRGGHPPNFFPYSTIPSQHLRPNYVDMAHMAVAAAAAAGQKPPQPQDMGKMQMDNMEYPPPPGADRNLVAAAYHHQQQQQQQDRNKQAQQQPPHPQIVYDVLRWQQEQGKMPPGPGGGAPASITRGYMKRGIND